MDKKEVEKTKIEWVREMKGKLITCINAGISVSDAARIVGVTQMAAKKYCCEYQQMTPDDARIEAEIMQAGEWRVERGRVEGKMVRNEKSSGN